VHPLHFCAEVLNCFYQLGVLHGGHFFSKGG
jgi:hypothetical protein